MPITPDEAVKASLQRLDIELEQIYSQIDNGLRKSYFGNNIVTISLGDVKEQLLVIIEDTYRKCGWDVQIQTGVQYNQRWVALRFSRSAPPWSLFTGSQ